MLSWAARVGLVETQVGRRGFKTGKDLLIFFPFIISLTIKLMINDENVDEDFGNDGGVYPSIVYAVQIGRLILSLPTHLAIPPS